MPIFLDAVIRSVAGATDTRDPGSGGERNQSPWMRRNPRRWERAAAVRAKRSLSIGAIVALGAAVAVSRAGYGPSQCRVRDSDRRRLRIHQL